MGVGSPGCCPDFREIFEFKEISPDKGKTDNFQGILRERFCGEMRPFAKYLRVPSRNGVSQA